MSNKALSLLDIDFNEKKEKLEKWENTLSTIRDKIEKKEDFSYVWKSLLENDIVGIDIYKSLICDYFGIENEDLTVSRYYEIDFKYKNLTIELPGLDNLHLQDSLYNRAFHKFTVKIYLSENIEFFAAEKPEFKKSTDYIFAEKYLNLLRRKGSLSEKLKLRYENEPLLKRYWLYYTKGRKRDKEFHRDEKYYENYITEADNFHKRQVEVFEKRSKKGRKEYEIFNKEVKPLLDKIFDNRYCDIMYNVNLEDLERRISE